MITLEKKKKKKTRSIPQSDSLESEYSSSLKSLLSNIRDVFQNIWLQKGVPVPLDYRKIVGISSNEEEVINSTVAKSQTFDLFLEGSASVHMAQENAKELMKKMDE